MTVVKERVRSRSEHAHAPNVTTGEEASDWLGAPPARSHSRGWLTRRLLLTADLVGLVLAFVVTELLFAPAGASRPFDRVGSSLEVLLFAATLPGWVLGAKLYGLYERDEERTDQATVDDFVRVFHLVTVGSWLFLAAAWQTGSAHPFFPKVLTFWGLAIALITICRAVARGIARSRPSYNQKTIILGAGDVGQVIARKLGNHPEYGINLLGFVDDEPKERRDDLGNLTLLGSPDELALLVQSLGVQRVIVAFSTEPHERTIDQIRHLRDNWIHVDVVPRLFEIVSPGVGMHAVEGIPLISLPPSRLPKSSLIVKRTMDLAISAVGLTLLAPVFGLIALLIKLESKGPVFFRQLRMGSADHVFRIFKFRTMVADAERRKASLRRLNRHARRGGDPRMFKIDDDPRVTRLGKVLRRYALDELPQLINVAKGEMCLVGPRPLILEEDCQVESWARRRLDLKPGMTGLWQVLGRSDIPFAEMVRFDYLYVTTWSVWNDLRLLFKTLPALFNGRDRSY
jgi:exopolysaccharide biosynthesis polyprenyl glycosylphosphotransferase